MPGETEPRRCGTCGRSLADVPYELWLFHSCRACALEPAPPRWSAGMAPGTAVKWAYTPRWHLDHHPETGGRIVADGGSAVDGSERRGYKWIGPGTWLVDRHSPRKKIGVIAEIHERDRGLASRLSIYWKPDTYQNISVSMALDHFIRGRWEVADE